MIHATAEIEPGAEIGEAVAIWHYCHVRTGAVIGKNCSLGRNVFIDSGVKIGDGTRIQNNVSIYNGVVIEEQVFIGPHVVFTNDKWPRLGEPWVLQKTLVKHNASLGAGVVVVCGNTIGEWSTIGAGAVVCRDILPFEKVIKFSEKC